MLQYEIIVDHSETANKCTILPLAYRDDFHIMRSPQTLTADILLHPDGIPLPGPLPASQPVQRLAAIDCVWRRLEPILQKIRVPHPPLFSIPPDFVTAYPRVSRKDFDPVGGLATIEAIFIAAALLGNWDLSLLREYYFAEKFLKANAAIFERYGLKTNLHGPVFQPRSPSNSQTRRLARGRRPRKDPD